MNRNEALSHLLEEAHRGDFHFPTSARLAIKIREALDDPECHLETAEKLIEAEPLLAAQVLGMANSVAYNPSGREITDLRSAAARLGFQSLRTLAMAFVTRQMSGNASTPAQKTMANALWEHTAHVAALARSIAFRLTHKNAEAALFCGLVHEIGGFYMLSRANEFPALIAPASDANTVGDIDLESVKNTLTLAVLRNLGVPDSVLDAIEGYIEGFLSTPPNNLADTLILADYLAPAASPLLPASPAAANEQLIAAIADATLKTILQEEAEAVANLSRALRR